MVADDSKRQPGDAPDAVLELSAADLEIFRELPIGLYRISLDGSWLGASAKLARMLGYDSVAELCAVDFDALYVDPADRERWRAQMAEHGRVEELDVALRARDGEVRWLRDDGRVVRGPDGRAECYEGVLIDVTAQHRAEQERRASEARYRALVESVPDALFRFGTDGICRDARLGLLEGVLPPLGQVIGAPIDTVFDPHLTVAVLDAIARCRREGSVAFEHRVPTGQVGSFHDVCVSQSGPDEALVMIRDVTALRRLREWLSRTERLASVGTLATGAAHEINNPLTAVVVNTEFVTDGVGELLADAAELVTSPGPREADALRRIGARVAELSDALADVSAGATRIAQVVRELKAFASPADDEVSWVDVESVLEQALGLTESQIRHRARLVRDFAGVPHVWGNAARLEELFVSFLVNASQGIEAGAADQNEIRVSTRVADDGRVVVEVRDSGAAIPPSELERIFDPFATSHGRSAASGIGMPVCQAIAFACGGEVTAESEAGVGSAFRLWLLTVDTLRRSSQAPAGAVRSGRIAIIDDEDLGGRALQRALGGHHDVVVMQSAREALAHLARGDRFDLILCDLVMPVMSGVDLHKELARRYPDQAECTVFITGGAYPDSLRDYLAKLPNPVLEKPVSSLRLRELAARQVAKNRQAVSPDSVRH